MLIFLIWVVTVASHLGSLSPVVPTAVHLPYGLPNHLWVAQFSEDCSVFKVSCLHWDGRDWAILICLNLPRVRCSVIPGKEVQEIDSEGIYSKEYLRVYSPSKTGT